MEQRPRGRQQNISGQGKSVYKRGDGLGSGPVGQGGRPSSGSSNYNSGSYSGGGSGRRATTRSGSGGVKLPGILILVLVLLFGGGGVGSLLGGDSGSSSSSYTTPTYTQQSVLPTTQVTQQTTTSTGSSLSSLFSSYPFTASTASSSTGWTLKNNTGSLNTKVASEAREKRTQILGNGQDTVTIMVYMCGADLESKSGMATKDIMEMCSATLSDKVNILIYTGGAKTWQNSVISNSTNQIYLVQQGGLKRLESNLGNLAMTKPSTLSSFIKYCAKNYPANRNELIFWDHGGGSISGYGYDEHFSSSGAMSLKGIREALEAGKTTFDFIGFDACLMATVENALMLSDYADYLIASEETEPGVGWYYTDWLTALSANTSMSTLEIGKKIADDFVSVCAQKCSGQKTTLSVTDLAELESTVPSELKAFSASTLELLQNEQYDVVSKARNNTREFATSTRIDQVDLVHLAHNISTEEADGLVDAILSAVKYNKTSSGMTDSYGLSIYFPYQKLSKVQSAVAAYDAIGMDEEYAECIQKFAALQASGQAATGGTTSALPSLLQTGSSYGSSYASSYGSSSTGSSASSGTYTYDNSTEFLMQVLQGLMSGSSSNSVLSGSSFLGRSLDVEKDTEYLSEHLFNGNDLLWTLTSEGKVLSLPEESWNLVTGLDLSVYYDDGEGYIDLGLDNVYDFTENGDLKGTYSGLWLAINDQPVAYYHTDTVDDGTNCTITGYVPALLNDERVNLILVFDNDYPYGHIAGAQYVYDENVTVEAKNLVELQDGDRLDFICDYYSYDGTYTDSYLLGDPMVLSGEPVISDVYVDASAVNAMYRFTDIYNQHYWSPVI